MNELKFRRCLPGAKLPELSNFSCQPGRAGRTPWLLANLIDCPNQLLGRVEGHQPWLAHRLAWTEPFAPFQRFYFSPRSCETNLWR
jgi:hypothetical protein